LHRSSLKKHLQQLKEPTPSFKLSSLPCIRQTTSRPQEGPSPPRVRREARWETQGTASFAGGHLAGDEPT
jgi:hypothetical protein